MARDLGTRGTLDIDVYRKMSLADAEADLRHAAAVDIGDWFRFEIGTAAPVGNVGVRLPITSVIGSTTWTGFHVDLIGSGVRMTGQPEHVQPLARDAIPEVAQHGYEAYPLVDHVADKVAATYERYGMADMPSTRYRDLVDLVSIVTGASVPAVGQVTALLSEFDRRQLSLPQAFDAPDRNLWEAGYAAEARRSLLVAGRTLNEALALVKPSSILSCKEPRPETGTLNRSNGQKHELRGQDDVHRVSSCTELLANMPCPNPRYREPSRLTLLQSP